jgi:hypothetical protein
MPGASCVRDPFPNHAGCVCARALAHGLYRAAYLSASAVTRGGPSANNFVPARSALARGRTLPHPREQHPSANGVENPEQGRWCRLLFS